MDKTGFLVETIISSVYKIDLGRKGLAVAGLTENGREFFADGLLSALDVFKEVLENIAEDIETVIKVEHAYITEERRYCSKSEPEALASTTAALSSFDDALLALRVVHDVAAYKLADMTWPHKLKYRFHEMPKDSVHIACIANRTRIKNTLSTPGINFKERQVFEQRIKNMTAIQNSYLNMQLKAVEIS